MLQLKNWNSNTPQAYFFVQREKKPFIQDMQSNFGHTDMIHINVTDNKLTGCGISSQNLSWPETGYRISGQISTKNQISEFEPLAWFFKSPEIRSIISIDKIVVILFMIISNCCYCANSSKLSRFDNDKIHYTTYGVDNFKKGCQ